MLVLASRRLKLVMSVIDLEEPSGRNPEGGIVNLVPAPARKVKSVPLKSLTKPAGRFREKGPLRLSNEKVPVTVAAPDNAVGPLLMMLGLPLGLVRVVLEKVRLELVGTSDNV